MTIGTEKRRFFRVDDHIQINAKVVTSEYIDTHFTEQGEHAHDGSLGAILDDLNHQGRLLLGRLERESANLVDYLTILDKKVNAISYAVLKETHDLSESNFVPVSLSASGAWMASAKAQRQGEWLQIKMLLPSLMTTIICYAQVIYCHDNTSEEAEKESFPYIIGMEFTHIREEDRELIIKHVVKRQMQQIREQKRP
mgnify:CR=1 FL=1